METLKEGWEFLKANRLSGVSMSDEELQEREKMFYAGATSMMKLLQTMDKNTPQAEGIKKLRKWEKELEIFWAKTLKDELSNMRTEGTS